MRSTAIIGVISLMLLGSLVISGLTSAQVGPNPTPTFRGTLRFITATPVTPTATASITPTPSTTPTPTITPTPSPTSIYPNLLAEATDPNLGVRFLVEQCFEKDQDISASIRLRNLSDEAIYIYLNGQIRFSINNSQLLPNVIPNTPGARDEFFLLEPNAELEIVAIDDLGFFIQGIGPESGINFFETQTIFGLPVGSYWVTAAFTNPHDGLEQQIDGSYLIPRAAWTGTTISREVRFVVVEDSSECPT